LSGESVSALMRYFKIPLENLVVIYDDLALPVGQVRLREAGSAGGHNGMKNIIQHLGSDKFKRIRIGIDKHEFIPVVDYVLGKFSKEDQEKIDVAVKSVADACFDITKMDFNRVMGKYNKKG
jgi:PTH1 family peptidyl-tRNA hydrolase